MMSDTEFNPPASPPIQSNQNAPHEKLADLVAKHLQSEYRKPIAAHTQAAFDVLFENLAGNLRPLILDSGCGSGESTAALARLHPEALVIGVDKSALRLSRTPKLSPDVQKRVLYIRAELVDFWRLLRRAGLSVERHYLLYPNPWPKKQHVQRRFHAHPVFRDLISLSPHLVLRSNWRIYLEEFAIALKIVTGHAPEVKQYLPQSPVSNFELKYQNSEHPLYQLILHLPGSRNQANT